jgi:hypothetical protein
MRYLLDADVFIRAKNDHYRFAVCPAFWEWVTQKHDEGVVYSVQKVKTELTSRADNLADWANHLPDTFFLPQTAQVGQHLAQVSQWAEGMQQYRRSAKDEFFASGDYVLVGHARATGMVVVTQEVTRPNSQSRIKLPDACDAMGVSWSNPFQMLEQERACFNL